VDKIIETLKIEEFNLFLLTVLKELQFATLNVLPFVYSLQCSCQCIGDSVGYDSPSKIRRMGDYSN
jgi:hypothetical protein